jgi:hypothetical protein
MQTSSISVRISDKSEFHGIVSALGVAHFLGVQFARIPARFRQAELVHPLVMMVVLMQPSMDQSLRNHLITRASPGSTSSLVHRPRIRSSPSLIACA